EDRRRDRLRDRDRAHLHGRRATPEDRAGTGARDQDRDPGLPGDRERAVAAGDSRGGRRPVRGGHQRRAERALPRQTHRSGAGARGDQEPEGGVRKAARLMQSYEIAFECPLPLGLHARPASLVSETAARFAATTILIKERDGSSADAKSILALIALE